MTLWKRMMAGALALALGSSLLTGCGGGSSSSGTGSGSGSSSQEETVDLSKVSDPYLYAAGVTGDTVVATVGEYEITAAELLYWINSVASQVGSQYIAYGIDVPWDTQVAEDGTTLASYVKDSALQTAALYRLLPEIGALEGVTVSQESLDQMEASQADLEERLGSPELTEHYYWLAMASADLLKELYQAGEMGALLQEHYYGEGSEGYPNDAEVLAYIDEVGYYKVKHILLATIDVYTGEELDEETQAAQRALAEDLLSQLRAAEDSVALFDELMNEYSEDPGLLYYPDGYEAYPDEMYPEFEEASLALQVGEISDIVESESGYHIILRLPPDLDAMRQEVVAEKMSELSTQWIEDYGIETTAAYDQIDLVSYWDKAMLLQQAVYEEISPVLYGESEIEDES